MGGQCPEKAHLEFLGFALFANPPEHVPESSGDEAVKLKKQEPFRLSP